MNETVNETDNFLADERKAGRPAVTHGQKARFVRALAVEHHVGRACEIAGFSRGAAYRLRARDADFARMWNAALEALPTRVQDAAIEEGIEGTVLRDDDGRPVTDADGNELRARNIPVLRDLMRKYMGIPTGNAVNVQVNALEGRVIPPEDAPEELTREINRRLYGKEVIDAEFHEIDADDVSDLL